MYEINISVNNNIQTAKEVNPTKEVNPIGDQDQQNCSTCQNGSMFLLVFTLIWKNLN